MWLNYVRNQIIPSNHTLKTDLMTITEGHTITRYKSTTMLEKSSYLYIGVLSIDVRLWKIRNVVQVEHKTSRTVSLQAAPRHLTLNPGLRRWTVSHPGLSRPGPQLNGGAAFCIDLILRKTKTETIRQQVFVKDMTHSGVSNAWLFVVSDQKWRSTIDVWIRYIYTVKMYLSSTVHCWLLHCLGGLTDMTYDIF